jgi:hypothetical protein
MVLRPTKSISVLYGLDDCFRIGLRVLSRDR